MPSIFSAFHSICLSTIPLSSPSSSAPQSSSPQPLQPFNPKSYTPSSIPSVLQIHILSALYPFINSFIHSFSSSVPYPLAVHPFIHSFFHPFSSSAPYPISPSPLQPSSAIPGSWVPVPAAWPLPVPITRGNQLSKRAPEKHRSVFPRISNLGRASEAGVV